MPEAADAAEPIDARRLLELYQTSRLTSGVADRTIVCDNDNRPTTVTLGDATVTYLYGPDGERVNPDRRSFGAPTIALTRGWSARPQTGPKPLRSASQR